MPRALLTRLSIPLALLLGALTLWWVIHRNGKPPSSSPRDTHAMNVAILPFTTTGIGDSSIGWGKSIQGLYAGELTGTDGFGVFDPTSMNGYIEHNFGSPSPPRTRELTASLRSAGASFVIDGNVSPERDGYRVESRLVDASSGEIRLTRSEVAGSEEALAGVVAASSGAMVDFFKVAILQTNQNGDLRPWLAQRKQNIRALQEFMLASDLIYRGKKGAGEHLRKAIAWDSNYVAARVWLISSLVSSGRKQEAQEQLARLQNLQSSASPFEQAMISWSASYISGDLADQELNLRRALDYTPGNNILLFNIGRIRMILKDYDGAIRSIRPAIDLKWEYSPAHYMFASLYDAKGDYAHAREYALDALDYKPVYYGTYYLLGLLSRRDNDTAKENEYAGLALTALESQPSSPDSAANTLGHWYRNDSVYERAEYFFRVAVAKRPGLALHHADLASVLLERGNLAGAQSECGAALALDTNFTPVYSVLGKTLEHAGDTLGAKVNYRRYLSRDSTSHEADEIRARLARIDREINH